MKVCREIKKSSLWTQEENKFFENTIAYMDPSSPEFLDVLEIRIPSKARAHILKHFESLMLDLKDIESGRIEVPDYEGLKESKIHAKNDEGIAKLYVGNNQTHPQPLNQLLLQSQTELIDANLSQPHASLLPHPQALARPQFAHSHNLVSEHVEVAKPLAHPKFTQGTQVHNQVNILPIFQPLLQPQGKAKNFTHTINKIIPQFQSQDAVISQPNAMLYQGDAQLYQNGSQISLDQVQTQRQGRARKMGVAWTNEEHRQFLEGLQKYGRGNWRNIYRFYMKTRTSAPVASHAQNYFLRMTGSRPRKRALTNRSNNHHLDQEESSSNMQDTGCLQQKQDTPFSLNMHDRNSMHATFEAMSYSIPENIDFMQAIDKEAPALNLDDFDYDF